MLQEWLLLDISFYGIKIHKTPIKLCINIYISEHLVSIKMVGQRKYNKKEENYDDLKDVYIRCKHRKNPREGIYCSGRILPSIRSGCRVDRFLFSIFHFGIGRKDVMAFCQRADMRNGNWNDVAGILSVVGRAVKKYNSSFIAAERSFRIECSAFARFQI